MIKLVFVNAWHLTDLKSVQNVYDNPLGLRWEFHQLLLLISKGGH